MSCSISVMVFAFVCVFAGVEDDVDLVVVDFDEAADESDLADSEETTADNRHLCKFYPTV